VALWWAYVLHEAFLPPVAGTFYQGKSGELETRLNRYQAGFSSRIRAFQGLIDLMPAYM